METIKVGRMNQLRVHRVVEIGFFLAGDEHGDETVLLPRRYAPEGLAEQDELNVFVYADSEDRLLATTEEPLAMVGQVAHLRVEATNNVGAFLDWGLPKDLLLPYGEQKGRPREGEYCTVYIYKDKYADRVVASMRLNRHIGKTNPSYEPGQKVSILIAARTDLGYKAVIQHEHWGLLFENEVFKKVRPGMQMEAWIKRITREGKVDLTLSPPRMERFEVVAEKVYTSLVRAGGYLPLHDKSPPDAIRMKFGISKKDFKAALGKLYKARKITISGDGIRTVDDQ